MVMPLLDHIEEWRNSPKRCKRLYNEWGPDDYRAELMEIREMSWNLTLGVSGMLPTLKPSP